MFLSGLSVGAIYVPRARRSGLSAVFAACLKRAGRLYGVHIALTVAALLIFGAAGTLTGLDALLLDHGRSLVFQEPRRAAAGIAVLGHQIGYFNILPMYIVLMLWAPFAVAMALRSPRLALGVSAALYVAARLFAVDLPNWPQPGGWFFNPLAWQLIFTLGVVTAARQKAGPLPVLRPLLLACVLVLAGSALFVTDGAGLIPGLRDSYGSSLDVSKQNLGLARLVHFLALAYVVAATPLLARLAGGRLGRALQTLGRHSLPVFAAGSLLSAIGQALLHHRRSSCQRRGCRSAGNGLHARVHHIFVPPRTQNSIAQPARPRQTPSPRRRAGGSRRTWRLYRGPERLRRRAGLPDRSFRLFRQRRQVRARGDDAGRSSRYSGHWLLFDRRYRRLGADRTYPARLGAALRARARVNANVRNAGIGGEIAETTLTRLKTALAAGWPELVIWQVGTNDALTDVDETRFRARIAEGVAAARAHNVPIILLDPQYTPGHADDAYARYAAIVDDIGVNLHVPVITRYAMMKAVAQRGGAISSWISPDGLHMSDVGYACLADALVKPIVSAIAPVAAAKL